MSVSTYRHVYSFIYIDICITQLNKFNQSHLRLLMYTTQIYILVSNKALESSRGYILSDNYFLYFYRSVFKAKNHAGYTAICTILLVNTISICCYCCYFRLVFFFAICVCAVGNFCRFHLFLQPTRKIYEGTANDHSQRSNLDFIYFTAK